MASSPDPSHTASSDEARSHDQYLADVLAEITDKVCQGEAVDFHAICEQHPTLADDLQQLWGAVLVTDTAGTAHDEAPVVPDVPDVSEDSSARWRSLRLPTTIGDFDLLEEVGRGGMGVVFRARQRSLDREVAIKMILRGRLASDADLQRFMAEAAATASLDHPSIVPVYEVGDIEGRPFFSMQFIEGQTLSQRVACGPMAPREAARMVAQIARAVAVAHQAGILHRDIKPGNILIAKDGRPMITDFGLAKQVGAKMDLTRTGMLVGTPAYMSPEQAGGRRGDIGPASDVYSLGCVLYFALTGRAPFVAESPMELVMLVTEQDPTPPRALRPSLDRDLEMITIRCLQKPADLRYPTAEALASDIEAYLADERVSARSGRFNQVLARVFRETHHAAVLEKWGLLWMWHSLVLLVASLMTWQMALAGINERWIYVFVWVIGLSAWAAVFWKLRQRMGPVTFIERQVAHVWGASLIATALLFPLEWWIGLEPLRLAPMLGVITAMVFLIKAGMLSGAFYIQTVLLLATSVAMAVFPSAAHLIFGIVAAGCFFMPGYKYERQRSLLEQR
ncbi:serine/threonine-protein kinase [Rhodopirellula europaea]|uniref:non-specific serine/threonine protein kinase n=1 Tax=Rhodopirellula europaea SH398 TaxID=1263868 RepID=M5SM49_9BACT|nr:serine/threonine-protein kinase [Rhodopirellula europaea]EMI28822.1 serine/threonine protein kinase [Rhodopirellula europaea SH398]MCR9207296.1 serine/threonine protein kinase [bacterium]